jgi:sulfur relay (sulfurtransferase) complex TusBCD TusD component (DsrE family)
VYFILKTKNDFCKDNKKESFLFTAHILDPYEKEKKLFYYEDAVGELSVKCRTHKTTKSIPGHAESLAISR